MARILSLWHDEDGATAVEYGLLAALIAAVMIASVTALGDKVQGTFAKVAAAMP